jgi:tetratricopeptide (TPR) repeat protein
MAIKSNRTKVSYYNYRADLNLELGNNKAAIKDYDYILSIEPDKYNIYYNRGIAENNNKNKINACLDWAFAQEKMPIVNLCSILNAAILI